MTATIVGRLFSGEKIVGNAGFRVIRRR